LFGFAMALSRSVGFAWLVAANADYDESRAIQFAKLAGAAYCPADSLESWSCGDFCNDVPVSSVKVCQGVATQAFVGMWEEKGLVSFEGSANILAWIRNLDFPQTATGWDQCADCKVHEGFLAEYNTLESCIKSSLEEIGAPTGSTIRTTGHSLGAALNNLAMLDLDYSGWIIEESYDFGKPRTGDSAFAAAWNSKFSDIAFRVTHHRDPVPQVPADDVGGLHFDWEHVQPEIWYEGDLSSGYQECDEPHHTTCVEQYWNIPFEILFHDSVDDHLQYLDLSIAGCPNSGQADIFV
jgi:predicted lipase